MILLPILLCVLIFLLFRVEKREMKAWVRHPDRPWSVTIRMQQEHLEWQREQHANNGG